MRRKKRSARGVRCARCSMAGIRIRRHMSASMRSTPEMTLGDLAAVMPGRPDGIVLPKCAGATDVNRLSLYLDAFEAAAGIEHGSTRIVTVATETARAVLKLLDFENMSPRLWGMMWGAEDLAASLGASRNRTGGRFHGPFLLARDLCLISAAAVGVVAIDTIATDINSDEVYCRAEHAFLPWPCEPRDGYRQGPDRLHIRDRRAESQRKHSSALSRAVAFGPIRGKKWPLIASYRRRMRRHIAACACWISGRASPRPIARCCWASTGPTSSRSSRRRGIGRGF